MPRGTTRKPLSTPKSDAGAGVVRMAKAVPTLERAAPMKDLAPPVDNGLPCSGRCGHCDCHPCKLHAPI
jgi:hypothetical protein